MRHPDSGVFELDYYVNDAGNVRFEMRNANNETVLDSTVVAIAGQNTLRFSNTSKIINAKQYNIKLINNKQKEFTLKLRLR